MNKHPDCEDRCQILEHKGYHTCSQTGRCEQLEAMTPSDSTTPETDALEFYARWGTVGDGGQVVNAEDARDIERERNELRLYFRRVTGYTLEEYKNMVEDVRHGDGPLAKLPKG